MFLPEDPGSANPDFSDFPVSGNIELLLSPAAEEQWAEFDVTSPGGGLAGNLNWSPEEKTITGTINLEEGDGREKHDGWLSYGVWNNRLAFTFLTQRPGRRRNEERVPDRVSRARR